MPCISFATMNISEIENLAREIKDSDIETVGEKTSEALVVIANLLKDIVDEIEKIDANDHLGLG